MVVSSWRTYTSTRTKGDTRYSCRGRKEGHFSASNKYNMCVTSCTHDWRKTRNCWEIMKMWSRINSGIIEALPENDDYRAQTHFLPHHGVIRTDRETMKLRVVFDGSAKTDKSIASINECLEKGPNLVPHLWNCDQVSRLSNYCSSCRLDTDQPRW